ncbi:MAG: GntG family PLP-dependent aldolase [Anaerolineales bacterium]
MKEKDVADFRSDTLTQPTIEMREAMANAETGDDWYGEDPTVNKLESLAASTINKPAAMFVASGTMANLLALLCNASPGSRVLVPEAAHIHLGESGGGAALAGVVYDSIPSKNGLPDASFISSVLELGKPTSPPVSLIVLENTHNLSGGSVLNQGGVEEIASLARAREISIHLDGARIFNAAIASETSVANLASPADTVSFCLSKGLGAPMGSILAGEPGFIDEARRVRAMLGGAWRQAGIVAAAGIVALQANVDRLAEDHRRAQDLAEGIHQIWPESVQVGAVGTNIVMVECNSLGRAPELVVQALRKRSVLAARVAAQSIRLVTHLGIVDRHVDMALSAFAAMARPRVDG